MHRALLQSFPGTPTVSCTAFKTVRLRMPPIIGSAVGHGAALDRLLAPSWAIINDGKVLAYPTEIDRLGGATNVQARWSRQMGAPFYHVEMSRTLRDKPIVDTDFRRRFAAAPSLGLASRNKSDARPGLTATALSSATRAQRMPSARPARRAAPDRPNNWCTMTSADQTQSASPGADPSAIDTASPVR